MIVVEKSAGSGSGEAERGWDGKTIRGTRRCARLADSPVPVLMRRPLSVEETPGGGRTKPTVHILSCIWLW